MNPLVLLPLMQALMGGVAQTAQSAAAPARPLDQTAPAPPGSDPTLLAALVALAQRPAEPVPEVRLPRSAAVVAAIVVVGFFALLAAIAGLLVLGREQFGAALAVLCVGFGVLSSKFGTVVDYLFGSSWGSRTKDARRQEAPGAPIVLPAPTTPAEPVPPTPTPAPGETGASEPPRAVEGIGRSTSPETAALHSDIPYDGRPASVRYCNPGAQYPSTRAAAFGQTGYGVIGGGHKIARFPHSVNGAAANFDLLSRGYTGMTVAEAGDKWTGGNGHGIPGYDDGTVLTKEMVADPAQAILIMKAIAQREAGKANTLTDEQWAQGHAMFLAGSADAYLKAPQGTLVNVKPPARRGTGADIVALARKHIGEAYVNVSVPKNDPNWKGPWDCAEFASWLVYQVGGIIYGCTNDSDDPSRADAYTGAWKADALAKGNMVSIAEAAATPGAFLLRYPPAPGEMGHIAVSDGLGGTIEAKGKAYGVVADRVGGRRWDTGVLVPGIDYSAGAAQTVDPPAKLYAIGQPNMGVAKVREIQQALAGKGFSPGEADGEYGQNTALAVVAFQQAQGLVPDGEVGPDTAAALGVVI